MIQKAAESSLEINQLEQIREGTPVHIRVQDKHREYFVGVRENYSNITHASTIIVSRIALRSSFTGDIASEK